MHWEAFIVIGLFTLGLGVLLFVPAWLWAKCHQRTNSAARRKLRLTKLGWLLLSMMGIALLVGFSLQYFAPESMLGQLVQTSTGRFLYMAILLGVSFALEIGLRAMGIKLKKEAD